MMKYNFFQKLLGSFYNPDLYVYVAKRETNRFGFRYLLLLLVIFWIPEIIKMHVGIMSFVNSELPVKVEDLPVVTIKDGIASFDKPCPYIMYEDGKEAVIFDNTGKYVSLEGTPAQVLVTDTKVIYRKDAVESREYSFSQIRDFTLTHEAILSWAKLGYLIAPICFLLIVPFAFLYRMAQALFYAVIALLIQTAVNTKYSFQTIYRLSIIAITPAFVADKFLDYFGLSFSGWSFICFFITLAYLYFAINSNKQSDLAASPELGTDNSSGNSGIQ